MQRFVAVVWVSVVVLVAACGASPAGGDDAGDDVEEMRCGDGDCSGSESVVSCSADCPAFCGDGTCGDNETAGTCSADCAAACRDDVCSDRESVMTCPADCPAVCGDSACSHQETAVTCSTDCPAVCGDDACTSGEGIATCPADCPAVCGDTMCSVGETAATCPGDCPVDCGDGDCTHDETAQSCASDCPSVCNDGFCSADETCAACAQDCGVCLPATIDVDLIGALIKPAKNDGQTWDGINLSSEQVDVLADLVPLLAPPSPLSSYYDDVAAFLVNLAIDAWAPPDPFGVAELAWNGAFDPNLTQPVATIDTNTEDTLSPQWPGPPFPGWVNVPTGPTLRVRITLEDEDVAFDDIIGTVELDETDLRHAYNDGGVFAVHVYDQGAQQTIYVTLSVTESAPPPVCGGECTTGTYSACTCSAADPCGWLGDGVCDSYCTANFPADHYDDYTDCAALCASDCADGTYSACSCSSVDPCDWQGDGVCDADCATGFPADHFVDSSDCP